MHQFPWMWVMFGMFFWMFMLRPKRLRACQPNWSMGENGEQAGRHHRRGRASRDELEEALAERDALIARLEERVRVLERIATEDSARMDSARLRAEIDALSDTPSSGTASS